MPGAFTGHAATISQSSQPSQMEQPAPKRLLEEPSPLNTRPNLAAVHDASLAVSGASRVEGKHIDKKSWGYVVRSGVAGGLAGCAVCIAVEAQELS